MFLCIMEKVIFNNNMLPEIEDVDVVLAIGCIIPLTLSSLARCLGIRYNSTTQRQMKFRHS